MKIIDGPITGQEKSDCQNSIESALYDFYRAFNNGDLALMLLNWSNSELISMSNPLGGVKRGWSEIGAVYERIFNGPADVYVEFYDVMIYEADAMFCAAGKERGYFRIEGGEIELAIRTSRIYQKEHEGWRQLHHHGSIDDPQLLNSYQSAVRSAHGKVLQPKESQ